MLERILNTPVWEDMVENIGENMVLKYVTLSGDVHLEIVKKPFIDKRNTRSIVLSTLDVN